MGGRWTDVHQRIKYINPNAKFLPSSNHSFNLFCLDTALMEVNSGTFFGTLGCCFAFFCMPIHRWEVLIADTGKSLKRVQDTRWSARGDAENMTRNPYKEILTTLEKLRKIDEKLNIRTDTGTL
ncbi:hypothetical protein NPIL_700821 [Nephila pilipes]|uniref:Uncharacterized protein n=1 Tax=Nephila pilipes TaxID=299642 RepID=A0A8X6MXG6_NEPPI|nr:hypothetical protein NPIL_700821 [Nephila pilipes]